LPLTFLGTIVAGFGAVGVWLILTKLLPVPSPRWAIPVVAGGAMLTFQLYVEYSWFQRTAASLPERARVVAPLTYSHVLQPWTLVVPQVNRFAVIDTARVHLHPERPRYVWAEVAFITRYYPTVVLQYLYDCSEPRRADILASMQRGADGMPEGLDWLRIDADDPAREVVCATAAERQRGRWRDEKSRLI
jgi:hypothetical protein